VSFRFQFRRGTTAERNASNPILAAGEPAVVLDSGQPAELVLGDGVTAMADLRAAVWDDDARLALAGTAVQPADLDDVIDGSTPLPYVRAVTLSLDAEFVFIHRGQPGPENTMEAFRAGIAANAAAILETDIRSLADGTFVLMHDTTVDRTTDGTGNVTAFTAPTWAGLDASADYPWAVRCAAPTWNQFVSEFGGKALISPQVEPGVDRAAVLASVAPLGLQGSILWQATTLAEVIDYKAAGYRVFFWWGGSPSSPSVADVMAAGADVLGLSIARPDAEFTTLVATGLPVVAYIVSRRVELAHYRALGVRGFMSDQHHYQFRSTAIATTDSWRYGTLGHGVLTNGTAEQPRVVNGGLELPAQTANTVTVGEVCPLANAAGSYTIDVDLGWQTLPASGSVTSSVEFCLPDDGNYAFSGAADSYGGGYRAYLRSSGSISLYRVPPGNGTGPVLLGTTQATNVLTAGTLAHIRISVTPTTVRLQRTDGTTSDTGAIADATYRGGYVLLGKVGGADGVARFQNLTIT
jgi:hypothetical protein